MFFCQCCEKRTLEEGKGPRPCDRFRDVFVRAEAARRRLYVFATKRPNFEKRGHQCMSAPEISCMSAHSRGQRAVFTHLLLCFGAACGAAAIRYESFGCRRYIHTIDERPAAFDTLPEASRARHARSCVTVCASCSVAPSGRACTGVPSSEARAATATANAPILARAQCPRY